MSDFGRGTEIGWDGDRAYRVRDLAEGWLERRDGVAGPSFTNWEGWSGEIGVE